MNNVVRLPVVHCPPELEAQHTHLLLAREIYAVSRLQSNELQQVRLRRWATTIAELGELAVEREEALRHANMRAQRRGWKTWLRRWR